MKDFMYLVTEWTVLKVVVLSTIIFVCLALFWAAFYWPTKTKVVNHQIPPVVKTITVTSLVPAPTTVTRPSTTNPTNAAKPSAAVKSSPTTGSSSTTPVTQSPTANSGGNTTSPTTQPTTTTTTCILSIQGNCSLGTLPLPLKK